MQGYDILMLVVLGGAALFGAWKGFAWQIASLASIIVSYFMACEFRQPLSAQIKVDPPWNTFVAMLILFLGTSLVIWMMFGMVYKAINRMRLREFDRQAGFLLGLAKGVALCVIVTLFAVTLLGENQRQAIIQSKSGYYIAKLLDESETLLPSEVRDFLNPYIRNLEEIERRKSDSTSPFGFEGLPANISGDLWNRLQGDDAADPPPSTKKAAEDDPAGTAAGTAAGAADRLLWSPSNGFR